MPALLPVPQKKDLEQTYVVDKKTIKEIASTYSVHKDTVIRWFKDLSIRPLEKWERQQVPMQLTDEQMQIIVGTLLGDGCIPNVKLGHNYLKLCQCRENAGYVRWLANRLNPYVTKAGVLFKTRNSNFGPGKKYIQHTVECSSIHHPVFSALRSKFYIDGKKIFPDNIKLTPLSLAIWFMDDGSKSNYSFIISTESFTLEDHNKIVAVLRDQFNINANIREYKKIYNGEEKTYNCLYFIGNDRKKLVDIIGEYVWKIPCMRYKLKEWYRSKGFPTTIRATSKDEDIV